MSATELNTGGLPSDDVWAGGQADARRVSEAVVAGTVGASRAPRSALAGALAHWRGRLTALGGVYDGHTLYRQARRFAAWLEAQGVGRGAVVVVAAGNHPAFLPALAGATMVGACALPLNPGSAPAMLTEIVRQANPAVLVVPRARAALLAQQLGGQAQNGDVVDGCSLIVRVGAPHQCTALQGTVAIASSGTTGLPKIVVHRGQSVLDNGRLHAATVGLGAGDRFLLALPCHFSFGLVAGLLAPLLVHADIVLAEQPISPRAWLAAVETHHITLFSATPSLVRRLAALDGFPVGLRTITIGGDEVALDDLARLRSVFNGDIHLTYGLSEAGPRVFTQSLPAGQPISAAQLHVGRALPGIETRLLQAAPDGDGETGELALLTPTAMLGRWDGQRLLRDDFEGPWLKTGDLFHRNAQGELKFLSRKKEVIVVGGEKIGAAMIRRTLLEHPAIEAARVWAEDHAELGAVPVAAVRYGDGAAAPSSPELVRWMATRLRRIEIPRRIDTDANLPISFK